MLDAAPCRKAEHARGRLRRLLLYPPELRARVFRQQLNTRCHTKGAAGGALEGITCSSFGYGVNSAARPRDARSVACLRTFLVHPSIKLLRVAHGETHKGSC